MVSNFMKFVSLMRMTTQKKYDACYKSTSTVRTALRAAEQGNVTTGDSPEETRG